MGNDRPPGPRARVRALAAVAALVLVADGVAGDAAPQPAVATRAAQCSAEAAAIEVRRFRDVESGGWAHKLDDQACEAGAGDCVASWNVITFRERPDELWAEIRDECGGDLVGSLHLHDAVLCRVAAAFPGQRLRGATLLGARAERFAPWQERLALASAASPEWERIAADRRRGMLHAGEPNGIFVRLFTGSNVGRELVELVARYGWSLSLASVEKVFEATAESLPFADRHATLRERGSERVITGAATLHFTMGADIREGAEATPAPRFGDALVGRVADVAALGSAMCALTVDLDREQNRTAAVIAALDDRREVLRADRISVRDIAFTLLERAGVIEDRVDRPVKQIVGCQLSGEWYRFHISDLRESDFERTRQDLSRGGQR